MSAGNRPGNHDSRIEKENAVNKLRNTVVLTILAAGLALTAWAADLTGQWTATFNTQIGEQNYTYTFKVDGEKLTGTAKNDRGTTDIANGTIKGDQISFDETLDFNGQTIEIKYTGTVSGDSIKLHRKVGDFAEEDLVANRIK
jgi:opacity protein-like surface antigen